MISPETVLQSRYRIVKQLGQGGMGAVYEAVDERLDTIVALKETLFTDERLRRQFEREARLLARLHHPALPRVSDHFSEGEGQFLVMQFIAGDDLFQMMAQKQGPFPADQVLAWGDQLLDALDYLHTQEPQIVHRDIKPQNLKLTSRGQIILLDFGLAKGQAGEISRAGNTSASIFGYTPNYAPLEQIQGLGTDARSDIYALSATLYHLMTGVKPPDALSRAAAIVNGQPDPLKPANEINPAIGPGVASVIARGMSQNREQRYSTASAMRAALKGSPEVATLTERAEAATVILQSRGSTLADKTQTELKPAPPQPGETTVVRPARSARRRFAPWAIAAAGLLVVGIVFGGFYAYQRRHQSAATPSGVTTDQGSQIPTSAGTPEQTVSSEGAGGGAEEAKVAEDSAQAVESPQVTKKSEKVARKVEKSARAESDREMSNEATQSDGTMPVPNTPVPDIPDVNRGSTVPNPRGFRRLSSPTVRTFPDGTQLIVNPDGSRVVIFPNGTRRVFRPGERFDRRRLRP